MKELYGLVATVLGVSADSISAETGPMNQSRWDSFHHVYMIMAIEEKYGLQFTPDEIINLQNVGGIVRILEEKGIQFIR